MGGFAALFILRRESQTALPKIALSVGFCLAVRVALSDRVADNGWRVGDVALCCACGKAMTLARCLQLFLQFYSYFLIQLSAQLF